MANSQCIRAGLGQLTDMGTRTIQFFTIRTSDRSVRSDRSLSGFLLIAFVCANYLTMYSHSSK